MFTQFSHVGVVVRDLNAAIDRWTSVYGLRVIDRYEVPEEGVRAAMLGITTGPNETCIEFIQPLDSSDLSNAVARRLATAGEGVYHLAFRVDNADDPINQQIPAFFVPLIESSPSAPLYEQRSLIHPRHANGVLVELLGPLQ